MRTHMTGLLLLIVIQFIGYQRFARREKLVDEPPTLKNGQHLGSAIRLGYRDQVDTFRVITIRFKITVTGFLDTLHISDNAPASFVQAAYKQLTQLDGQWKPQKRNGKPVKSKWIIARFYVLGYRENESDCYKQLEQAYQDAFRREEELFLCDKKLNRPLKCLIEYIEGFDCYLCPPLLSQTMR